MFGEAEEDPEDDGNNNNNNSSNNNNESLGISPLEFSLSFIFEKEEDDKESSDISTLLESTTNPILTTLSSNNTFCNTTINTTESSATATVMTFPPQQVKADFLLPHQWDSLTTVIQRGKLVKVDLTQLGITANYAHVIHLTLVNNSLLQILKLGYNDLRDNGISIISPGITSHPSLKVLDVGFNTIGDVGCIALSQALVGNYILETLYLSGNSIAEQGVAELSHTLKLGCGVLQLYLTANKIGPRGVMYLAKSISESNDNNNSRLMIRRQEETACPTAVVLSSCDSSYTTTATSTTFSATTSAGSNDHQSYPEAQPMKLALLNAAHDIKTCNIQELFLGGTSMRSEGCVSIAKMLLTNSSLKILSLPNNNLSDCDAILLAHSLSRNKNQLPLEKIHLSFNRLTCVGVEALMNAIWGSQTLREIKLDSNDIKDRGAQLAAVVLTSVPIEVLDIGFNRIGSVGIKALMKTLAENTSVRSLTLSGNAIDTTSARAVSYALALNRNLKELFMDNCSATYGAQRHIAAGIVSNKFSALRILRGFHLGAIVISLGFPSPVENWSNDQLLKFISLMWQDCQLEGASMAEETSSSTSSLSGGSRNEVTNRDIADPKIVIKVANRMFEKMNDPNGTILLQSADDDTDTLRDCPTVPGSGAVILEMSNSGSLVVPEEIGFLRSYGETSTDPSSVITPKFSISAQSSCSLQQKRKLAPYLQIHCDPLDGLSKKPFNKSEMWKLRRIYSSPIDCDNVDTTKNSCKGKTWNALSTAATQEETPPFQPNSAIHGISGLNYGLEATSRANSMPSTIYKKSKSQLYRKPSYRCLKDVTALTVDASSHVEGPSRECQRTYWRHSFAEVERGDGEILPSSKRARGNKLRIDLYPRIKMKLEEYRKQRNELPALVLMRQLLYLEQHNMHAYTEKKFEGKNIFHLTPDDIEALLLDLL